MAKSANPVLDLIDDDDDEVAEEPTPTVAAETETTTPTRKRILYFLTPEGIAGSDSLFGTDGPDFDLRARAIYEDLLEQGIKPNPKDQPNFGRPTAPQAAPTGGAPNGVVSGGKYFCDVCKTEVEAFDVSGKHYSSEYNYNNRKAKHGQGLCSACWKPVAPQYKNPRFAGR